MTWDVIGADRESGEPLTLQIEAEDEAQVLRRASRRGLVVSDVRARPDVSPPLPSPTTSLAVVAKRVIPKDAEIVVFDGEPAATMHPAFWAAIIIVPIMVLAIAAAVIFKPDSATALTATTPPQPAPLVRDGLPRPVGISEPEWVKIVAQYDAQKGKEEADAIARRERIEAEKERAISAARYARLVAATENVLSRGLKLGDVGRLPSGTRVLQILNEFSLRADLGGTDVIVRIPTYGMVDEAVLDYGRPLTVASTTTYTTVLGAPRTVFVLVPFTP